MTTIERLNRTINGAQVSLTRIGFGCMKIALPWGPTRDSEAEKRGLQALEIAVESGINCFDHADIYCSGKGEVLFGEFLRSHPGLREDLFVQSKCGIRFQNQPEEGAPHRFDHSKGHIIRSVEGSLERLGIDTLDGLLLHRPDALVEPEEVAEAFDELHSSGKVRHFGVSNHTADQIALLQSVIRQPLIFNQVMFNLLHTHMLDEPQSYDRGEKAGGFLGTLESSRLNKVTLQAYSPLAHGALNTSSGTPELMDAIDSVAHSHGLTREGVLIAWILRHPAGIQPIIGTCDPDRIRNCCRARSDTLSREEWYQLWLTARGQKLP